MAPYRDLSAAQTASAMPQASATGFCLPEPRVALSDLTDGLVEEMQRLGDAAVGEEFTVITIRLFLKKAYPCT